MANSLNLCQFIGNLTRDPESRFTASGDAICSFSIAVNWKTKDKAGAEFINCVAFGKLGEIVQQYCVKGSSVYISGRFKTDKYTDKEGIERYATRIMADQLQMLGGRSDTSGEATKPKAKPNQAYQEKILDDELNDQIPF